MAKDEIGPVPAGLVAGAQGGQLANAVEWINRLLSVTQRDASQANRGRVLKMPAQSDSTATTVADLRTDFNALLAKLRTAGLMDV